MSSQRERYKRGNSRKRIHLKLGMGKVITVVVLIAVIGYGIYTYIGFSKIRSENPLKNSNADYYLLSSKRDALEKTLIVFEQEYESNERIEAVYLYSENKEKAISVLTYIPGWIEYTGLEKDFGEGVPISSFRYAGDFLQEGRGMEYAIWQLEQVLGSNIDQYIWISGSATKVFNEKLGETESNSVYAQYYSNGFEISQGAFFLNGFVARLGWFNLILSSSKFKDSQAVIYSSYPTLANTIVKLKQIHKSTLSTRPYLVDMSSSQYLSQEESVGGVGITNYILTEKYDEIWRSFVDSMIDRDLEKERVRVEVYNGSGLSGYAAQYARRIRNSGCEVVRYDNAPSEAEKTQFYIPNEEDFPNSIETILELFPGTYEIINNRPSFMTTGDIVIILGKDIPTVYSF